MIEILKNTVEVLESKAVLYCEYYGPQSDEVMELNHEIYLANLEILNLMVEEN
jgi:hypothetical protein